MHWLGWSWLAVSLAIGLGIWAGVAIGDARRRRLQARLETARHALMGFAGVQPPIATIEAGGKVRTEPRANDLCNVRWGSVRRAQMVLQELEGEHDG